MNENVQSEQRSSWKRTLSDLVIRIEYTKKEDEHLQDKKINTNWFVRSFKRSCTFKLSILRLSNKQYIFLTATLNFKTIVVYLLNRCREHSLKDFYYFQRTNLVSNYKEPFKINFFIICLNQSLVNKSQT